MPPFHVLPFCLIPRSQALSAFPHFPTITCQHTCPSFHLIGCYIYLPFLCQILILCHINCRTQPSSYSHAYLQPFYGLVFSLLIASLLLAFFQKKISFVFCIWVQLWFCIKEQNLQFHHHYSQACMRITLCNSLCFQRAKDGSRWTHLKRPLLLTGIVPNKITTQHNYVTTFVEELWTGTFRWPGDTWLAC